MADAPERKLVPLENIIALKVTNTTYAMGFLIALSDVPTGYFSFDSQSYMISSFSFSLLYIMCHLLSNKGFNRTARILFIIVMCLHFGTTLKFVGPFVGVEIYSICMLIVPLLIFSKSETPIMLSSYMVMALGLTIAEYFALARPPILLLSDEAKHNFYMTNILSVAAVVTFLIFYYSRSSISNYINLQAERNKSEKMIRDLLPQAVADQMIRGEQFVARSYGECTVLFADLIGFTGLSERLSPIHLVELLNDIFSDIDVLCEKHGIEKIKTIGDCYMAATGALEGRGQPVEMAHLGLEIVDVIKLYADRTGYPLAIRVGINTGQVVSGVIGSKRRLFDIWGKTVNEAQLLESSCRRNSVFVSESVQWRLKNQFIFSEVHSVTAKSGKTINGYYIEGEISLSDMEDHQTTMIDREII